MRPGEGRPFPPFKLTQEIWSCSSDICTGRITLFDSPPQIRSNHNTGHSVNHDPTKTNFILGDCRSDWRMLKQDCWCTQRNDERLQGRNCTGISKRNRSVWGADTAAPREPRWQISECKILPGSFYLGGDLKLLVSNLCVTHLQQKSAQTHSPWFITKM